MGNNPLMDWGVWPLDNGDTGKNDPNVWTNLAAMPEHAAVIAEHKQ